MQENIHEELSNNYYELSRIRSAINGMGTMFEQQSRECNYTSEELFGVGQCLKILGEKLAEIEDSIRLNTLKSK